MTTDFRALCAELIASWDADGCDWKPQHQARWEATVTRARAALAKADEPTVPEGREPAAADLEKEFRSWWKETYGSPYFGAVPLAAVLSWTECVLARWGNHVPAPPADGEAAELVRTLTGIAHWRRRGRPGEGDPSPFDIRQADRLDRAAELLQRQALVPPADGEVVEVVEWLHTVVAAYKSCRNTDHIWSLSGNGVNARLTVTLLTRAAELLQRQVLVPVSASERLPGPEDCAPWPQPSDKSGWCWMSRTVHGFYGSFAIWEQVSVVPMCREVYTHWLPAHALPLPEVGED